MKSLRQVLQEIKDLESKTSSYLQTIGYKTELASKKYKHLIKTCTSLSIVFLHFHLYRQSLDLLSKALKIDLKMFFEGSSSDRSWTGRILIYCNLSYLLLKCGDGRSSLKFLYDSESLLTDMRNSGKATNDLRFSHSFLVFLSLLSLKRFEQSEKYLGNSIHYFSLVSTRYDVSACKNIFFLLEFSRVVLEHFLQNEEISVQNAVKQAIITESPSEEVRGLIGKLRKSRVEQGIDLLSSEIFADCVYLTVFFPFVDEDTPQISLEEFRRAKRLGKAEGVERVLAEINSKQVNHDCYSALMKSAIEQVKVKGYK